MPVLHSIITISVCFERRNVTAFIIYKMEKQIATNRIKQFLMNCDDFNVSYWPPTELSTHHNILNSN